jgi:predicted RNA-binding protein with TRAM domain
MIDLEQINEFILDIVLKTNRGEKAKIKIEDVYGEYTIYNIVNQNLVRVDIKLKEV